MPRKHENTKKTSGFLFRGFALSWLVSTSVFAHHNSGTYYDNTKRVEVKGVVTKYVFRNPHSSLTFEEADAMGRKVEWQIEMGPAGQLTRIGWTPEVLKPGTKIRVSGQPSRTEGAHAMCCATITRLDGAPLTPAGRTAEGATIQ